MSNNMIDAVPPSISNLTRLQVWSCLYPYANIAHIPAAHQHSDVAAQFECTIIAVLWLVYLHTYVAAFCYCKAEPRHGMDLHIAKQSHKPESLVFRDDGNSLWPSGLMLHDKGATFRVLCTQGD
jgi:hypothetical protein